MVRLILLGIVSLVIPLAGFALGAWYFFGKKKKTPGVVFAGLGLLAIIVIIGASGSDSSQPSTAQQGGTSKSVAATPKPVPTPEPVPESVSLQAILDLRDGNEVAADAKYIEMYVSMEGEIQEIHEKDIFIIPIGSDDFQMAGAKCSFDRESQAAELMQLRKGQSITIVGIIKGISDFGYNKLDVKPCKFN